MSDQIANTCITLYVVLKSGDSLHVHAWGVCEKLLLCTAIELGGGEGGYHVHVCTTCCV